ncbi:MAG TPA: OmpH family outer membrane protein [Bacteroidota bacterium]|nr:OmpH family outer membrane protein [Bacteroidota bacterium]
MKAFTTTTTVLGALVCSVILGVLPAAAQQKIGYVNSEKILQELPAAKEAKDSLAVIVKAWQDQLDSMSKDLQAKYEDYQKKQGLYNDQTKQAEQKKLIDEEQQMNDYKAQKFGQQGELAMQQDRLMQPIKDRIFAAIKQIALENKLSFVFDKAGDVLLLYGEPSADYTFKVIDRLKRGGR